MKNYAVIFGAKSYEHEISIVSAVVLKNVFKHDLSFIFCDKDRQFYLIQSQNMKASYFSSGEYKKSKKLILSKGDFAIHGFFGLKKLGVDVYINLVHGMDGEDGKISALLDFYEISYIGPRLEASVLSFSKFLSKNLAKNAEVKTLPYELIKRGEAIKTNLPIILKPSHLGSSIGISIVKDSSELEYALDVAFEFDDEVLVEPFMSGIKEYNLAGCYAGGKFIFSVVEEPMKKEFLSFDEKYLSFMGDGKPRKATISVELENKLKDAFEKIYRVGNFYGALIRCDFFVLGDEVYINEINPNPGSLANYLFDDFTGVVDALSDSLPRNKNIKIDYKFINSITHSKGGKLS
ncbi:MAG: D-alanine--D-alanine ligase [Campylobacter sp.]|nr:D-alanine--D-alanine ligase [Campylobacter sp.]